jgi:hypothetical protein
VLDLPPGELDAMIARLAEGRDADLAEERWKAYVATTPAPHAAYLEGARKRLSRPGRKGRAGESR